MLIGEYEHNVDIKGRIIIPSNFRKTLGDKFYITKGIDGCLFILPLQEWEKLCEKIENMPISKARELQRFFFSGACEANPDKQSRVLLPQPLRDYANISKNIAFVGLINRSEIWDLDRWGKVKSKFDKDNITKVFEELEL